MDPDDFQRFSSALVDLGLSRSGKAIDERTIDVYWRGLQEEPWGLVRQALHRLEKDGGSRFPALPVIRATLAGLRSAGSDTATRRAQASVAAGEYGCLRCLDTGFAYVKDGRLVTMDEACEHRLRHVRPCPCRPMNANYQAREIAGRTSRAGRGREERA